MLDFAELKKFFLFNLIGSLIIAALVAVVTVLIGTFNEISARVLFTLFMVVIHSLVCLMFIWDDSRENTFERLSFFINALFILLVLSFLTSILGIWKIIPGDLIWHLYQTYFVIGFASLHSNILAKALNKETYIDAIIYSNYLFIVVVVSMLLMIIYAVHPENLGEIFYRILGAVAIIDGTLSILTIIFYRIFMHNHPKEQSDIYGAVNANPEKKKGLSVWIWILIVYLVLQFIFPFLGLRLFRYF